VKYLTGDKCYVGLSVTNLFVSSFPGTWREFGAWRGHVICEGEYPRNLHW